MPVIIAEQRQFEIYSERTIRQIEGKGYYETIKYRVS